MPDEIDHLAELDDPGDEESDYGRGYADGADAEMEAARAELAEVTRERDTWRRRCEAAWERADLTATVHGQALSRLADERDADRATIERVRALVGMAHPESTAIPDLTPEERPAWIAAAEEDGAVYRAPAGSEASDG